jgi:hypothetical protein
MSYERKTYDLFISEELKEILTTIESESLVAQLLLRKRHDKESLVESPVNFISVSSSDKTKLAYLSADRIESIDPSLYWSSSRRFAVKPGSFVTKLFKDIPSKEVEKFSNLYRAQSNKAEFKLSIVDGSKMLTYYHINSYAQERGTLGASCMKYDNCQDYLGIYTHNSDKVKMLVMLNDEGGLIGRALLWNLNDYKIMDRIYTISDEEFAFQFKKWATDNGYLYKSEQNWYNTLNFENLLTPKKELKISIKLDEFSFSRYPYVDTFKFFDKENGILQNYMEGYSKKFKTLCASDGGQYGCDYLVFDDINRVLRQRGDSVYVRYLDIRTSYNNVNYSEIHDEYILRRDSKYDEEINEYLFDEEYDQFNNIDMINKKREYFKQLKKRREKNKQVPNNPFSELTGDALHSEIFQILQSCVSSEVEEVLRRETQDDVLPF